MESTLYSTTSLLTLTKTLNKSTNHRLFRSILNQSLQKRFLSGQINNGGFASSSSISLRKLCMVSPISTRLACISNSAGLFAASGGGSDGIGGGNSGGGGGGDSGSNGGEIKSKSVGSESEELSALSPDVIILDVSGMTCGGCAASVKRILESQPNVSTASVNLATETAIVWPVTEAKAMQNWQQQLGEALAKQLTTCGFKSNLRGQGAIEGEIA